MIKPSDLRIGNLINSPNGIISVSGIETDFNEFSEGEETVNDFLISNLNPIQLTEEWLLKFGFQYNGKVLILKFKDGVFDEGNCIEYFKGRDYTEIKFGYYGNSKIKYVHQLQNLYHALTGEELTI